MGGAIGISIAIVVIAASLAGEEGQFLLPAWLRWLVLRRLVSLLLARFIGPGVARVRFAVRADGRGESKA
ncbi:hypothetical protein [Thermogemmatispora sp.]|uniref:hypothetical protein n=1 Tax=Thermogemmatispora sp. TaxID=1968838 RepID=UPI0035E42C63